MDFALNNLQMLICHKTHQTKPSTLKRRLRATGLGACISTYKRSSQKANRKKNTLIRKNKQKQTNKKQTKQNNDNN